MPWNGVVMAEGCISALQVAFPTSGRWVGARSAGTGATCHTARRRCRIAQLRAFGSAGRRDGVFAWPNARAEALGIDLRELGSEKQNERRIINPDHEQDDRACGSVRRRNARFAEVEADQEFSDRE